MLVRRDSGVATTIPAASVEPARTTTTGGVARVLRPATRLLVFATGVYTAGTLPLAAAGFDTVPSARLLAANLIGVFAFGLALSCIGWGVALTMRTGQGFSIKELAGQTAWRRLADAAAAFASFAVFNATFWRYKNIIPDIIPFRWDDALFRLDRALHFGDPWPLLHPILGHPPITHLLTAVYGPVWIVVWMSTLAWIAWSADERLRRRYVIAYTAMWVLLGNVAATLLSSAGPAFFHEVVPAVANPYAELRAYLNAVSPGVIKAQDMMWQANAMQPHPVLVPPVSAAPSLHVALASLNAMAISTRHRVLGLAAWAMVGMVFMSTIHLGLHYAVDAYISVAGVTAIWWAAGRPHLTASHHIAGNNHEAAPTWTRPAKHY